MSRADALLGRTADEWFAAALRWYVEEHQACPCCRSRHCVIRSQWGARLEFYCTSCDFSVAHDSHLNHSIAARGDSRPIFPLLIDNERPFETSSGSPLRFGER